MVATAKQLRLDIPTPESIPSLTDLSAAEAARTIHEQIEELLIGAPEAWGSTIRAKLLQAKYLVDSVIADADAVLDATRAERAVLTDLRVGNLVAAYLVQR